MAALLFLGCPTEADSEPESTAYERTALWAAIVAAETSLSSTQVSVDGSDIAKTEKWVSQAQYDAFKRAIDDARTVAYTLSRAAAPTPAEEPAIATLTAAQTVFDNQKENQPGVADPVSAADLASINFGSATNKKVIVTGEVALTSALNINNAAAVVTVAPGAKLTTMGTANSFDMSDSDAQLIVKGGGTLEIANGTTSTSGSGFKGTITVESGATVIDRNPVGGSLFTNTFDDTGSYVLSAGAVAIIGNDVFVGPATGNAKGQVVQLNSGTFTIKVAGYELAGDATLAAYHGIRGPGQTVKLSATSTLTVDSGATLLYGEDGSGFTDFFSTSANGAKIVLSAADSSITWRRTTNEFTIDDVPVSWSSVDGNSWKFKQDNPNGWMDYYAYLTGPATLVKGASGWTKQ
jgi:hypothetical protein